MKIYGNVKIKSIKSGASHCLALTDSGVVYSWGNGQGGRLGHSNVIGKNTPEQIMRITEKVEEIVEEMQVCNFAQNTTINQRNKCQNEFD